MSVREEFEDAAPLTNKPTTEASADGRVSPSANQDFRHLIEANSTGLIGLDQRGCITLANPVACRLLGYRTEELIGTPFSHIHAHVTGGICPLVGTRYLDEQASPDGEHFLHREGHLIPVAWTAQALVEEGQPRGCLLSFLDLTETRRHQAQVLEKEARLEEAQRIARLGNWHVRFGATDEEDQWTLSKELNTLYEQEVGTVVHTETGFQAMPEDEQASIREIWEAAKRGDGPTEWEHRTIINGRLRWMHVRARFIRDHLGRAVEAYGINQDITQRKNTELARQASEDLTRGVMESIHHRIAVLDHDGVIIRTNRTWREFANTHSSAPARTGEGVNYLEICAKAESDPWAGRAFRGMQAVLSRELLEFTMEYPCHGPDQQRWYLLQVTPLGSGMGGLVATHVDITCSKRAELAVAAVEQQLRTILDAMPGLVGYVDRNEKYRFNNRGYEACFNRSADALKGCSVAELMGPDNYDRLKPKLDRAMAGEKVAFDFRLVAADGTERQMQVTYVPDLDEQQVTRGIFSVCFDMTEQKQAQAALRALSAEMQSLLEHQVATQTAAILAHDLNQPLNAAATFCEAALRLMRVEPTARDQTTGIVRRATEEIQRAGNVVRRMLKTLQEGEPLIEALELPHIITEAIDLFVQESAHPDVSIKLVHDDRPLTVKANRLLVEKVLINLLRNAHDACIGQRGTPGPASITIRLGQTEKQATVGVEDNGPGIPEHHRPHLFEAFFTTKARGIGMGLAVSRAIVETLGGALWHQPQDQGTTFNFSLPLAA